MHQPGLEAIAAEALRMLGEYHTQECCNLVRSLWVLSFGDDLWSWEAQQVEMRNKMLTHWTVEHDDSDEELVTKAKSETQEEHALVPEWPEELALRGYVLMTHNKSHGSRTPHVGDKVWVSYVGKSTEGLIFDAAENLEFTVGAGEVIAGLDNGITGIPIGQSARLFIHHSHGYGACEAPTPYPIPPLSTIIYDVKLIRIEEFRAPHHAPADLPFACDWKLLESGDLTSASFVDISTGRYRAHHDTGDRIPLDKGRQWLALLRFVANLSLEAWLLSVDERGSLLMYWQYLSTHFCDAEQIVRLYTTFGSNGSIDLDPDFFVDVGIAQAAHRHMFQQWFQTDMSSSWSQ